MIETSHTVTVRTDIDATWAYAKNVERWAEIMPGYQSCQIEDEDNSLWVLKVGVGGMVRTVKVRVHVEKWAGPARVDFSFKLQGDPVTGSGCYLAAANAAGCAITLKVQVEGSGPMAPMWEAMGGPVLPKFALRFAEQLKTRIEVANGIPDREASIDASVRGVLERFACWLGSLLQKSSKVLRCGRS